MTYGAVVWGSAAKYHLDTITNLQKKAIKIMNFVGARDHIELPFKTNKILPFEKLRTLCMLKLLWKTFNDITPFVRSLLGQNHILPSNRDDKKVLVPFKNTSYARNSVFYSGCRDWNWLPIKLKSSPSINTFSTKSKALLLEKLEV